MLLSLTAVLVAPPQEVNAATTYIKVETFAKGLAEKLKLKQIQGSQASGFVNVLLEKGIIKEGDFTSYTEDITRQDAAVLLNRADEYLYGDTLDIELVELALEKRISDINKIPMDKRTEVVKCYLKGYISGFSNGTYSTDREFRGSQRITRAGALKCFKMLTDKSLRYQVSPDGQLIRTTKLPKYAKYYPYILASFPNSYYDWKFVYEDVTITQYNPKTGKMEKIPLVNLIDYASPIDIDKLDRIDNFTQVKKERLDTWVNKAKTHMESVFNVDYRTIGDEWVETMVKTDYTYGYWGMEDQTRSRLYKYINRMKKNKTIVECDKVVVDGSTLYYFAEDYYLRVYVRYRIVSSNIKYKPNVPSEDYEIFYTGYPVNLNQFELGEWQECCFDIALSNYSNKERENLGVLYPIIVEPYFTNKKPD